MSFLIIPTCDLFYKIVMKVKRVLLSGTLLLSLLFSFALGTEEGKIEDFTLLMLIMERYFGHEK